MAKKHSSKARPAGRHPASREPGSTAVPPQTGPAADSNAVPSPLVAAIENERRNLEKAESTLGCLVVALEYGYDGEGNDPDYADVARTVRTMLAASIERLDATRLARLTSNAMEVARG